MWFPKTVRRWQRCSMSCAVTCIVISTGKLNELRMCSPSSKWREITMSESASVLTLRISSFDSSYLEVQFQWRSFCSLVVTTMLISSLEASPCLRRKHCVADLTGGFGLCNLVCASPKLGKKPGHTNCKRTSHIHVETIFPPDEIKRNGMMWDASNEKRRLTDETAVKLAQCGRRWRLGTKSASSRCHLVDYTSTTCCLSTASGASGIWNRRRCLLVR